MRRYYVDITGIPDRDLEILGYYRVETADGFALYTNKGDAYIVHMSGERQYIYVDDPNDAEILRGRARYPAP